MAAQGWRTGGVVYAAGGASIFKPRGTDTVPAMLTPGEFVIKKSAVDEIGVDTLSALNRGGKVAYRAGGGPVNMLDRESVVDLYFAGLRSKGTKGVKVAYKGAGIKARDKFQDTTIIKAVTQKYSQYKDALSAPGGDPAAGFLVQMVDLLNKNAELFGLASGGSSKIADQADPNQVGAFQTKLLSLNNSAHAAVPPLLAFAVPQFFSQLNAIYSAIESYWQFKRGMTLSNKATTVGPAPKGRNAKAVLESVAKEGFNEGAHSRVGFKLDEQGDVIEDLNEKYVVPARMAGGGHVDSVPAMLTPGEFIMSKGAVQQHGIGFMKNLNQGRIPGFRRGGVVGTGNVQYKQDGGSVGGGGVLSLDPTRLQGVLDNFNAQFSASLDNVVGVFSGFGDSLQQLVASFNGITMTHNVQVEGLISLGGLNVEAIKEELSTAIGTMVADQVSQTMDRQAKEFKSSG